MANGRDQILEGGLLDVGPSLQPGETLDSVCRGQVQLIQRSAGYRFSVDALLLAAFANRPRGKVVDLGTGCGIVAVLLAKRGARSVVGVELQPGLAQLAFRNVRLNRCDEQVHIINADLRDLRATLPSGGFDLVVSNPPYIARRAGHLNPDGEKAVARHEVCCVLDDVTRAARYLLHDGGGLRLIFPSSRLVELLHSLASAGLEPKRMRLVHTVVNRPAKLVLLEAIKAARVDLEVQPPLYLHDESGAYTPEAERILADATACMDVCEPIAEG